MPRISITQLARNLADVVNRVAYRGERFTVVRGNRAVAELGPAPRGRPVAELGAVLKALPHIGETDAEAFAQDLDEARRTSGQARGDPWAS